MPVESTHAKEYWFAAIGKRAADEALRGLSLHGHAHSYHEMHSVLREEEDELWEEVKRRNPDHEAIYKEAVQVAAMAIRLAVMAAREAT